MLSCSSYSYAPTVSYKVVHFNEIELDQFNLNKQVQGILQTSYIVKLLGQVLEKMHSVTAVIHVNSRKKYKNNVSETSKYKGYNANNGWNQHIEN